MMVNLIPFEGESPLEVQFLATPDQTCLTLDYMISGNLELLMIPENTRDQMREIGLWENTCFEFFIKNSHSEDYFEFNFSPSSRWNIFVFHEIRGPLQEWKTEQKLSFVQNLEKDKYLFQANIPWSVFPEGFIEENQMGYSPTTILKLKNGKKVHFANLHPDNKLDFHRYQCFTEKL